MNNSHENVKLSSSGNWISSSIIVGSSRSSSSATSVSESPTSNTLYKNWVTSFPSQCLQDETQHSAIQESSIVTSSTNELLIVPPAPLRAIPSPPINTIPIPLTMQPPSSYFSLNTYLI
uniref:Uncharacterized protein n=1 Tax=Acrobeloides nanus TaxID=290746 RepID=A0A914CP20_9BILA